MFIILTIFKYTTNLKIIIMKHKKLIINWLPLLAFITLMIVNYSLVLNTIKKVNDFYIITFFVLWIIASIIWRKRRFIYNNIVKYSLLILLVLFMYFL